MADLDAVRRAYAKRVLAAAAVVAGDGAVTPFDRAEGVYVNAGATRRRPSGRPARDGLFGAIHLEDRHFPCAGARDPASARLLAAAFEAGGADKVRRLRRDAHEKQPSCWLHAEGWCLSTSGEPESRPGGRKA